MLSGEPAGLHFHIHTVLKGGKEMGKEQARAPPRIRPIMKLEHLCAELTASETVYAGTQLRLIFQPVGTNEIPRGQES